jgi:hypothetical protein
MGGATHMPGVPDDETRGQRAGLLSQNVGSPPGVDRARRRGWGQKEGFPTGGGSSPGPEPGEDAG